jgi:formylglycine-generating enzyme required for sulfatase activity
LYYEQQDDPVGALFGHWEQPRWRETLRLAVGYWVTERYFNRARQFLQRLLDANDQRALVLAASALDDANAQQVVDLRPLLRQTTERLRALAFDPTACPNPRTRNEAGDLLDRLGGDTKQARPALDFEHPDYWAERIEPGAFYLGEEEYLDYLDYLTVQTYALARFPVTNRQYLAYLEDLQAQDKAAEAERRRPRYWPGSQYRAGEGNHPVVGISWYDAAAFAKWLDTYLKDKKIIPEGDLIRLPTEPEWERAAAYPVQIQDVARDKRTYPWGNEWPSGSDDSIRANTDESGLKQTSVVGIFPHGAAACGAQDLAGNVWEWCSTTRHDYKKYPTPENLTVYTADTPEEQESSPFVLRGGSWGSFRSHARCAYRLYDNPADHVVNGGVRLARLFSS